MLWDGDVERWRASVGLGEAAGWNPFRAALIWPRVCRVVVGAGDRVHLLDLDTGALCVTLDLSPDHFGYLVLVEVVDKDSMTELLLVLGWTDVRAYTADISLLWHAREVAVDGIAFDALDGSILRLRAEMDPPGGWFAVALDVASGRELDRQPTFHPS